MINNAAIVFSTQNLKAPKLMIKRYVRVRKWLGKWRELSKDYKV